MKTDLKKEVFLISAVNLVEGGPLSILTDAVSAFINNFSAQHKLVLLVYSKNLVKEATQYPSIEIFEYSYPKKSWLLRIWFEYIHCWFISKRIKPAVWFSLHDITPNVQCNKRVVYCHNPAPFYKLTFRELLIERSLFFFTYFYGFFYRFNIQKNKFIIVQQQWMRDEFVKRYNVVNTVVAYPEIYIKTPPISHALSTGKFSFLYPSLPRVFKNFEVLLEASALLEEKYKNFEIVLTFNGSENRYAKQIKKKYSHLSFIKFIGVQKREGLLNLYNDVSCVVFASRMETWGLPISEAKLFNKPILVADEKYARETVGCYKHACFFESGNAISLSDIMEKVITGTVEFNKHVCDKPLEPFVRSWQELYKLILTDA